VLIFVILSQTSITGGLGPQGLSAKSRSVAVTEWIAARPGSGSQVTLALLQMGGDLRQTLRELRSAEIDGTSSGKDLQRSGDGPAIEGETVLGNKCPLIRSFDDAQNLYFDHTSASSFIC